MKTLLAALLLSALSLTACSKQVSQPEVSKDAQPAVSQESKHGYELAKTWDNATAQAKITEADDYYTSGLTRFGRTEAGLAQLHLAKLTYEFCVNEARLEASCNVLANNPAYKNAETNKSCADAGEMGPKHIAECNKLIDDLPKLIEKQNAALKEELKQ